MSSAEVLEMIEDIAQCLQSFWHITAELITMTMQTLAAFVNWSVSVSTPKQEGASVLFVQDKTPT